MINVIGLGFIGLPTALMFASNGIKVVGTDINIELIGKLNNKELTFNEDGLEVVFERAYENINFTTECVATNLYLIAVPTPYIKKTKKIDSRFVLNALNDILAVCQKGSIIIIESTIAPGTIENQVIPSLEAKGFIENKDVYIVHAPERIIPGNMIYELTHNSRIIGGNNLEIAYEVKQLYEVFCKGEINITSVKMAEFCKVVENTFRDINIAFANELTKICNEENLDVYELITLANKHPRVNILKPGPGVGGHCLAVDPWFLVGEYNSLTKLTKAGRLVNESMPYYVYEKLKMIMEKEKINFNEVGFYGLSYKENISDYRQSPSLKLIQIVKEKTTDNFRVYDPYVKTILDQQYTDFDDFIRGIKLIVVLVAHRHIITQDLSDLIVFDTVNCIKQAQYKL